MPVKVTKHGGSAMTPETRVIEIVDRDGNAHDEPVNPCSFVDQGEDEDTLALAALFAEAPPDTFEGRWAVPLEVQAHEILAARDLVFGRVDRGRSRLRLSVVADGRTALEGQDYEHGDAVWYAYRTLLAVVSVRDAIKRGNIDDVARWALDLGRLTREAELKFEWEREAIRARTAAERLLAEATSHNACRQSEAAARTSDWQALADDIWSREPDLSAVAVARLIARKRDANPDTVRRRIKRKK